MGAGLGLLRLSPAAFWAMTPRELAAALRVVFGPTVEPPSLSDLEALMQRYPDEAGRTE